MCKGALTQIKWKFDVDNTKFSLYYTETVINKKFTMYIFVGQVVRNLFSRISYMTLVQPSVM